MKCNVSCIYFSVSLNEYSDKFRKIESSYSSFMVPIPPCQTPLPRRARPEPALDVRRVHGDDRHPQGPEAERALRHLCADGERGGRGQRALRDGGRLDRPHRARVRRAARDSAEERRAGGRLDHGAVHRPRHAHPHSHPLHRRSPHQKHHQPPHGHHHPQCHQTHE